MRIVSAFELQIKYSNNINGFKSSYYNRYPLTLNIILIVKYCGGCDCNNFQLITQSICNF